MNNSRSNTPPAETITERSIMAGFGGQGIMLAGKIVIRAGMLLGRRVTYIPSYGAEVRGGTAHCHVIVSREEISSPIIVQPDFCLVMNSPSLAKFADRARSGGMLIINSSLVDQISERADIVNLPIPAGQIAEDRGNIKAANIVMLGAYLRYSQLLSLDALREAIRDFLPSRHHSLLEINLAALQEGYERA